MFPSVLTDDLPFNSLPPCEGDTSSIRVHLSAPHSQERGSREGAVQVVMMRHLWWCVCVCVQETGSSAWHQPAAVHLCLLTNELIIYGTEGREFSHQCTWSDREKRVTAVLYRNSWISFWPASMRKVKETYLLSWHSSLCSIQRKKKTLESLSELITAADRQISKQEEF